MSTQHPTQTVAQPSNTSTMDVDDTMSQHIDTLVNPTNTHHIQTTNKYTHKINEVKTNSTSNTTEVHRILSMTPPPPTSLPPSPNLAEFTQSMVVPNRKSLKTLTVITGDSTNKMLNINIGRSARTELTHTRTHSAHGQYDMSAFPDIYEQDFVNSAPATDDHHYSYSSLTSADYHHQHSIKHFNPYNHEGSTHLQLPLTHMYPINPLGISSPLPMSSEDEECVSAAPTPSSVPNHLITSQTPNMTKFVFDDTYTQSFAPNRNCMYANTPPIGVRRHSYGNLHQPTLTPQMVFQGSSTSDITPYAYEIEEQAEYEQNKNFTFGPQTHPYTPQPQNMMERRDPYLWMHTQQSPAYNEFYGMDEMDGHMRHRRKYSQMLHTPPATSSSYRFKHRYISSTVAISPPSLIENANGKRLWPTDPLLLPSASAKLTVGGRLKQVVRRKTEQRPPRRKILLDDDEMIEKRTELKNKSKSLNIVISYETSDNIIVDVSKDDDIKDSTDDDVELPHMIPSQKSTPVSSSTQQNTRLSVTKSMTLDVIKDDEVSYPPPTTPPITNQDTKAEEKHSTMSLNVNAPVFMKSLPPTIHLQPTIQPLHTKVIGLNPIGMKTNPIIHKLITSGSLPSSRDDDNISSCSAISNSSTTVKQLNQIIIDNRKQNAINHTLTNDIEPLMIQKSNSSSMIGMKGPVRSNYAAEGLSQLEVDAVLDQLNIRQDTLRDCSTDFRPVFSCIRPIVCHTSNTPFYAQCSTAKLGYCTWCRQLRRGNQKQGSICNNCGERLTAKYHRWYPHLVRLEPLQKERSRKMYRQYKPVFERYGITWHNERQLKFVLEHYMIMKVYLSTENFNVNALHLERTYMVGVFAGREFNTGALARKLLREGCKLAMFRADFPDYYDFLRDERAAVAEQMNLRFFQGNNQCYFHSHYTNIEGWYDPSLISRELIIDTFKELCNTILQHTAMQHMNGGGGKRKSKQVSAPVPMPVPNYPSLLQVPFSGALASLPNSNGSNNSMSNMNINLQPLQMTVGNWTNPMMNDMSYLNNMNVGLMNGMDFGLNSVSNNALLSSIMNGNPMMTLAPALKMKSPNVTSAKVVQKNGLNAVATAAALNNSLLMLPPNLLSPPISPRNFIPHMPNNNMLNSQFMCGGFNQQQYFNQQAMVNGQMYSPNTIPVSMAMAPLMNQTFVRPTITSPPFLPSNNH